MALFRNWYRHRPRRARPRCEQLEARDVPAPIVLDPNLAVRTHVAGLDQPTSMAFLGPNDLFVLEKATGRVQHVVNGAVVGTVRVADNLDKPSPTDPAANARALVESESLLFGRNFGVTTDIQTGPNGNLFVVSLSDGAIYEIHRVRGGGRGHGPGHGHGHGNGGGHGHGHGNDRGRGHGRAEIAIPPTPVLFAPPAVSGLSLREADPPAQLPPPADPPVFLGVDEPVAVGVSVPGLSLAPAVSGLDEPIGVMVSGL
jgi:hypothetical protein